MGKPAAALWAERVRGGPNAILRSALFAGIASKRRQVLGIQVRPEKKPEGVTIAAQDGIKITYAGVQFTSMTRTFSSRPSTGRGKSPSKRSAASPVRRFPEEHRPVAK